MEIRRRADVVGSYKWGGFRLPYCTPLPLRLIVVVVFSSATAALLPQQDFFLYQGLPEADPLEEAALVCSQCQTLLISFAPFLYVATTELPAPFLFALISVVWIAADEDLMRAPLQQRSVRHCHLLLLA